MTANGIRTPIDRSIKIMARLKEETGEYHSKLASLPYFNALMDHQLPLESYVSHLQALAVIHGVLETEIAISEDKSVLSIWHDGLKKLPLLQEDLKFFAPRIASENPSAIVAALALTQQIRLRRIENSITLLGYLYVFEGSTLGNSMHRPDISATYFLNDLNGCRYYASYQDQVPIRWNRFSEKMNETLADTSLHDPIIESAQEAFLGLETLYKALYPDTGNGKTPHVARINPEAGNHPIPDDKREIQAALKASTRGWFEFLYYEQRYGERGKRFSDSDTCWLVTLTRLDPESIQKQIEWLGRVLATRGMPQIMLEQTLIYLHEELTIAIPDNTAGYEKLLTAAETLRKRRIRLIPENEFESLSNEFDQLAGAGLAHKFKNTGRLVVSSVIDENIGINGAVAALQEWLTDPDRFPENWINTVNSTIEKTKHLLS